MGLTGGVASGKSTVSAILAELGAVVIDGDKLAREVVEQGYAGAGAVVEAFGPEILTPEGDMDRAAVGQIVFNDEAKRKLLESIVHPLVFERYAALEASAPQDGVVIHDIPLLAESGRADTFDEVIVVDAPRETQVDRMLRDRGWTREDAESRIAAQATREQRLAIATYVIENTGTLEELRTRVEAVHAELVAAARAAVCHQPQSGALPAAVGDQTAPGAAEVRMVSTRRARDAGGSSGSATGQAARSGSPRRRSFWSASRSSWRTRSAEMPCLRPMSASLCWRPSTSP